MANVVLSSSYQVVSDFLIGSNDLDAAVCRQYGSEFLAVIDPCQDCEYSGLCDSDSCGRF